MNNITGKVNEKTVIPDVSISILKPAGQINNTVINTFGSEISNPRKLPAIIPDLIVTASNSSKTTFTQSGSINPDKVKKYGLSFSPSTLEEMFIANDIKLNGDLSGAKTERLTELIAQRMNSNVLEGGKYPHNHGFDVPLGNSKGTLLIESKQPKPNGGTALSYGAGGNIQLTDGWINAVNQNIRRFNGNSDTQASFEIDKALGNGELIKAVSIFDRTTGKLIIIPVE